MLMRDGGLEDWEFGPGLGVFGMAFLAWSTRLDYRQLGDDSIRVAWRPGLILRWHASL